MAIPPLGADEPLFNSLVIDPPWFYPGPGNLGLRMTVDGSRRHTGAVAPYDTMSLDQIQAIPVGSWANTSAHLYLWATNRTLYAAHDIARGWGFDPKTIITWGKVQDDGEPSRKMGRWFRSATEHVVFAVRGDLRLVDPIPPPSTLMLHRRLPHSVKPDAFYDMVERYSPGPYLDVFSRRARLGWTTWGDQSLHGVNADAE